MIELQKTKCAVCGEDVPYTDVRNKPITCCRKMCKTNYIHAANRKTITGETPDPKEVGKWPTSESSES